MGIDVLDKNQINIRYLIGQKLDSKFDQIWDKLKNKKISFTLGDYLIQTKTKQNIDLFYPDPGLWSGCLSI